MIPFWKGPWKSLCYGECLIALCSMIDSYFAIKLNTICLKQVLFFFSFFWWRKLAYPMLAAFKNFNVKGKLRRVLKGTLISILPKCYCSSSHPSKHCHISIMLSWISVQLTGNKTETVHQSNVTLCNKSLQKPCKCYLHCQIQLQTADWYKMF